MSVKISAVIPVYNMEGYLDRCMNSLLAQTYSDWEALLVDDGSTDHSPEMCDAWAARDVRVRVLHRENGGLGMARNSGLDAAEGEYVTFLDPDDYFGSELLEHLADAAERCGTDVLIAGYTVVGSNGQKRDCGPLRDRAFCTPDEQKELLLNIVGAPPENPLDSQYGVSVCGRLYRRALLESAGLRFVSEVQLISEDLIFNMDVLERAASAAVITDTSYYYCTNAGSLSKRHREDRFEQDRILYRAVRDRLARYPEPECRLFLDRFLISRARYDIMQEVDYHDLVEPSYPLVERTVKILQVPELRDAVMRYPWWKLPKMQAVFTWCMKRQRIRAMLLMIRLKRRFLSGGHQARRKGRGQNG